MSQFGPENTEVPTLGSAQTVKAGVSKPSSLGVVAEVFGAASKFLIEDKNKKDKIKSEAVITDFMNKQTAIADAVDQGKYNSAFGRSMMRKNFIEYANNNPAIRKELIKMQKDIVGTAGIGNIITKDSEQERLTKEQNSALVREGLVDADASEDEFSIARNRLTASMEAKRKHDLEMQTINLQKAKVGLNSSELELLNKQEAKSSYDYLAGVSGAGYDSFRASMNNLVTLAESGEHDKASIQAEIERQFNEIQTQFAIPLSKLGATQATALMKPFQLLKETALKVASGELQGEAAKRAYETALNLQKAVAMQDPDIAKAAAISSIFGHDPTVVKLSTENSVARFMAGNGDSTTETTENPFVIDTKDRGGFKAYTDSLNRVINDDKASPEAKAELKTHLEKIVEGTKDYEGFIKKNPKGAIELMNWVGSQGFLKALRENPESFKDMEGMKTILKEHYSNEVWGMVESEFRKGKFRVIDTEAVKALGDISDNALPIKPTKEIGTKEAITYEVDGDGSIKFVGDMSNQGIKVEVDRLNRELAPIINKTARATAHLDGRNDYKSASEEAMKAILGDVGNDNLEGGAGEDTLEVEDFQVAPQIEGEAGQLSFLVDKNEGGGQYDTLFGFSQRSGRAFAGVDVSKMTVGEAAEFSSVSGKYGKWVKSALAKSGQKARIATPMGRYQIVGTTLRGLIKEMNLDPSTPFNAETQDAMFRHLIERRLKGKKTMSSKIAALKAEWEGFKHVSDSALMAAIEEYEASKG